MEEIFYPRLEPEEKEDDDADDDDDDDDDEANKDEGVREVSNNGKLLEWASRLDDALVMQWKEMLITRISEAVRAQSHMGYNKFCSRMAGWWVKFFINDSGKTDCEFMAASSTSMTVASQTVCFWRRSVLAWIAGVHAHICVTRWQRRQNFLVQSFYKITRGECARPSGFVSHENRTPIAPSFVVSRRCRRMPDCWMALLPTLLT